MDLQESLLEPLQNWLANKDLYETELKPKALKKDLNRGIAFIEKHLMIAELHQDFYHTVDESSVDVQWCLNLFAMVSIPSFAQ